MKIGDYIKWTNSCRTGYIFGRIVGIDRDILKFLNKKLYLVKFIEDDAVILCRPEWIEKISKEEYLMEVL